MKSFKRIYAVIGFTLFEILVVCTIIVVLLSISLPNYAGLQSRNHMINQQQVLTEAVTWMSLYSPGLEEQAACDQMNAYMSSQVSLLSTPDSPIVLNCIFKDDPVNRFHIDLVKGTSLLRLNVLGSMCQIGLEGSSVQACEPSVENF